MILLNKSELAAKLGVSLSTLSTWLERWPDFPAVRRGANGTEWQFNADAVAAFLRGKRDARAAADAAAYAESAPLLVGAFEDEAAPTSASERLKLAQVRILEDRLARERGFYVVKADMVAVLAEALPVIQRSLQAIPAGLVRRHKLPDPVAADLEALIAAEIHMMTRRLAAAGLMPAAEVDEG
ncbi:terminase small subunit [Roseomonas frigidaquae]|uniref:Terminase small subunit n=1 Tax=Falsiroseomonas frigidaquae TaxID=487318 RepID=A0ABX1F814_9PROT|nr:terminase small subunit [Falsiroseomonas frigidaquae]NKE48442.1 terminase small subunit [Falsiroseomonas frigidaquae]